MKKWLLHFIVLLLFFNIFDFFTNGLFPGFHNIINLNSINGGIQLIYSKLAVVVGYDPQEIKLPKINFKSEFIQERLPNSKVKNININALGVTGSDIIKEAQKQLGKPYIHGKTGPNSFDCSGLAYYIYNQLGIKLPRASASQIKYGKTISSVSNLRSGDLVFFKNTNYFGKIRHVAIYYGKDKDGERLVIHANHTGGKVCYQKLAYLKGFYIGKRIIK
jgi:hypothetical protein